MPMLERSAAALEPYSFHKAFPSVHSRRKLCATFWRHGAAELDIWATVQSHAEDGAAANPSDPGPRRSENIVMAASLPFDFLYPHGALGLMRRLSPGPIGTWNRLAQTRQAYIEGKTRVRAYSVNSVSDVLETPQQSRENNDLGSRVVFTARAAQVGPINKKQTEKPPARSSWLGNSKTSQGLLDSWGAPENSNETDPDAYYPTIAVEAAARGDVPFPVPKNLVEKSLKRAEGGIASGALDANLRDFAPMAQDSDGAVLVAEYERIWREYKRSSPAEQVQTAAEVLLALSRSKRLVEAAKIIELYSQIPRADLTTTHVAAVVKSHCLLHSPETGLKIYQDWISHGNAPAGFGIVAFEALKASDWLLLAELWNNYVGHKHGRDPRLTQGRSSLTDLGDNTNVDVARDDVETLLRLKSLRRLLVSLYDYINDPNTPEAQRKPLMSFWRVAMVWVLPQFSPKKALALVVQSGELKLFEELIKLCLLQSRGALATYVYLKARAIPNGVMDKQVLIQLIDKVFLPQKDREKMELVLKDLKKSEGKLSTNVYKRFLKLYALLGDIESFHLLRKEFCQHHPEHYHHVAFDELQLYNTRGEASKVQQAFDGIKRRYRINPRVIHWNVLLAAHRNNAERALEIFADLCEAVEPNEASFATIIKIIGRRGDLEFTQELYGLAVKHGLENESRVKGGLIDALCHNNLAGEAEQICIQETRCARDAQSRKVVMEHWSSVLRHYATNRDLVSFHRILGIMGRMGLDYDERTYYYLLMALAFSKQAHHALHLLRAGVVDGFFKPQTKHYLILMAAFYQTGEFEVVEKIDKLLTMSGVPKSAKTTMRNILARLQIDLREERSRGEQPSGQNFRKSMTEFAEFLRLRQSCEVKPRDMVTKDLGQFPAELFATTIFYAATSRKNKEAARELLHVYRAVYDKAEISDRGNISIMTAMLHYESFNRDFDDVMAIFNELFRMACKYGRPKLETGPSAAHKGKGRGLIVPTWSFVLADSIKTMHRLFEERRDIAGLKALVERIRDEGFELTNSNWNHYVQTLARLGEWREAFEICERVLMPHWRGWYNLRGKQARVPPEVRRMSSAWAHRRATSYTIAVLGRCYKELLSLAPWSARAEELLAALRSDCPISIKALSTYDPAYDPSASKIASGADAMVRLSRWKELRERFHTPEEAEDFTDDLEPLKGLAPRPTTAGTTDVQSESETHQR